MFSTGLLHIAMPVLADQEKKTQKQKKIKFVSSVQSLDAILKTCQEWWLIGMDGERSQENPSC